MTGLLTGLKHGLNRFPYCSLPHVIAVIFRPILYQRFSPKRYQKFSPKVYHLI